MGKVRSSIYLLSSRHLDAELHAGIDGEPPLATHVTLVTLGIDVGLVCSGRKVVDTVIENLEDIIVADAAR